MLNGYINRGSSLFEKMPSCAVATCKNTSATAGDSGIIFHPFPRNEKEALEWFIKCRRKDKKRPNAADRICSEHFHPSDYERDIAHDLLGKPSNPKLKYKATPTLHLPYLNIKPADARKILPPSLARQLSRSELQKGNTKKLSGPRVEEKVHSSSESKEFRDMRRITTVSHCQALLENIFKDESFMDVTLVAENKTLKAHKAILSQASSYFKQVLNSTPDSEVKISDVVYEDLLNVINYIYRGEVYVKNCDYNRFREVAKTLDIYSLLEELERIEALKALRSGFPQSTKVCSSDIKDKDSPNAKIKGNKFSLSASQSRKMTKHCSDELKNCVVSALLLLY